MSPSKPTVSVVIPTRDRPDQLRRCLDYLDRSTYPVSEVMIVDDAGNRPVPSEIVDRFTSVKVIRNNERRMLTYSRNLGASESKGNYIFFLDDDNVISPTTVEELARPLGEYGAVATCSPIIYYLRDPERVWTSTIRKGRIPGTYVLGTSQLKGLTSTFSFHDAFMVKRLIFDELGGFDQENFPIHFGELDFAYRLRQRGFLSVVNPRARVWHDVARSHMHVDSRRAFYTIRNRVVLMRKYAPKPDLAFYLIGILPLLTTYYSLHHALSSSDNRASASHNLLLGLVDALAFRVAPSPRAHSAVRAGANNDTIRVRSDK